MAVVATRITAPWWKLTRTAPAPHSSYTQEQLAEIGEDPGIKPSAEDTITETWVLTGYSEADLYDEIIKDAFDAGLPEPGEAHPVETGWYVSSAEFEQLGKDGVANVVILCQRDPELLPIEEQYFTNHITEEAYLTEYDTTGTENITGTEAAEAYVNSRGDPLSPAPQFQRPRVRWEVTKRYAYENLNPDDLHHYTDCVNDGDFPAGRDNKYPAHTVFLNDIRSVLVKQPYWHYVVTYVFEMAWDTYDQIVLDAGPMYNDADGNKVLFADDFGTAHGGINLLDGAGGKGDAANPSYISFGTFIERDFNQLPIFDP